MMSEAKPCSRLDFDKTAPGEGKILAGTEKEIVVDCFAGGVFGSQGEPARGLRNGF